TRASNITPDSILFIGTPGAAAAGIESRISQSESKVVANRATLARMTKERTPHSPDRDLGEDRSIPRRDFLQGALVAAATTLAGPLLEACAAESSAPGNMSRSLPGGS